MNQSRVTPSKLPHKQKNKQKNTANKQAFTHRALSMTVALKSPFASLKKTWLFVEERSGDGLVHAGRTSPTWLWIAVVV